MNESIFSVHGESSVGYRPCSEELHVFEADAPAPLQPAQRSLLARYPATMPTGLSCRLFETQCEPFAYSADAQDSVGNLAATMSTDGSRKLGVLLGDLCEALSRAEAFFDSMNVPQPSGHRWRKTSALFVTPCAKGQDVDMYEHTSDEGWTMVAARPSSSAGDHRNGVNLYLEDPSLAERLATALNEGLIRIREAAL